MASDSIDVISGADRLFLERAAEYLEHPSFLMKVANLLGTPIETLGKVLPARVRDTASDVATAALQKALRVALLTVQQGDTVRREVEEIENEGATGRFRHNLAAGVAGALAGSLGLAALAVELPITTTIMMRNIGSVAASFGEDLNDREVQLQCLAVFSLGGAAAEKQSDLSGMESTYYTTRFALGNLMREAAQYVARVTAQDLMRDLAAGASPALVRYIAQVAARFNLIVSQKLLAQAVPALGAVGGATVNVAFNAHFDRVARYHFGIRALERKYGREAVQLAYKTALEKSKVELRR